MFISEPPPSPERDAMYQEDIEEDGVVLHISKIWSWNPQARDQLFDLMGVASDGAGLSFRDRGFLVSSSATAIANSGCALAWGNKLATVTDVETAASVVGRSESDQMTPRDRALSSWARKVANHAETITEEDVSELREAGLDDEEIFNITVYVAMRVAFSKINDALNAPANLEQVETFPERLVSAVDFGRPAKYVSD